MKKLTLKDLLSKITPNNVHPEINSGVPVGKEILDPYYFKKFRGKFKGMDTSNIREKVDREI